MTDPRALAFQLAVLAVLLDRVRRAQIDTKALLDAELTTGERLVPTDGDSKLAAVQKVKAAVHVAIVDEDKLAQWVAEHYPTEVEIKPVLRPAFKTALITASRKAGEPCTPDGTLDVPGIAVTQGSGYVRVTLTDEAAEVVERLWQQGRLSLDGAVRELPGGES